ncbi:hypothetical protein F5Y04DRAFT_291702 [Hypomontagnella monticulosa]|nr:hypothetical protein F5Y04DRAFT_291702 [Hypomontagnella monticulosa]
MPASEVIAAINMLCVKDAAVLLDSDPKLQAIINKAADEKADKKDLDEIEQASKDKYPAKPVDAKLFEVEDLTRMAQHQDEPLIQYYTRVQQALRLAGGRDECYDHHAIGVSQEVIPSGFPVNWLELLKSDGDGDGLPSDAASHYIKALIESFAATCSIAVYTRLYYSLARYHSVAAIP